MAAVENYLERCIDIRVGIETLEPLMEREEGEVCMRYILKHAMRRGEIFHTEEKKGSFRGKQKALVGAPRREGSLARKLTK